MAENYITRGVLFHLLSQWQSGELTTQDVWDWASHHFLPGETDYDDWEDDSSVAQEILCLLDSLDLNLVVVDDVAIHLTFLETPIGDFQEGYRRWRQAHEQIDFAARRLRLQDDLIYAPHCKATIDR
jgi:hypothetical protein